MEMKWYDSKDLRGFWVARKWLENLYMTGGISILYLKLTFPVVDLLLVAYKSRNTKKALTFL